MATSSNFFFASDGSVIIEPSANPSAAPNKAPAIIPTGPPTAPNNAPAFIPTINPPRPPNTEVIIETTFKFVSLEFKTPARPPIPAPINAAPIFPTNPGPPKPKPIAAPEAAPPINPCKGVTSPIAKSTTVASPPIKSPIPFTAIPINAPAIAPGIPPVTTPATPPRAARVVPSAFFRKDFAPSMTPLVISSAFIPSVMAVEITLKSSGPNSTPAIPVNNVLPKPPRVNFPGIKVLSNAFPFEPKNAVVRNS